MFSPHGTLDIIVDDNIIFIEAQGPWNIEYLALLHEEFTKAVCRVDIANYAILITPKGEAISAEARGESHISFIKKGNAKAVALNLAYCTTALLTERIFTKLYRAADIKHAFFDSHHDARLWLDEELKLAASTSI